MPDGVPAPELCAFLPTPEWGPGSWLNWLLQFMQQPCVFGDVGALCQRLCFQGHVSISLPYAGPSILFVGPMLPAGKGLGHGMHKRLQSA